MDVGHNDFELRPRGCQYKLCSFGGRTFDDFKAPALEKIGQKHPLECIVLDDEGHKIWHSASELCQDNSPISRLFINMRACLLAHRNLSYHPSHPLRSKVDLEGATRFAPSCNGARSKAAAVALISAHRLCFC